ncbi:GerAB/ArcD/ProY family transporter [Bacillus sp. BP-3]|uniref:GerAB/ArcD/ProY family transporter n=1 Tax=Bacillus sp. BP-3 TaxID=3022773 RepID=UPI00232AF49C|nr:GerAB/ArcD/ProY family transporter [Bacillus sp. BP-3]MDC2867869.1 GerAB/ArcD/ProY family transporter [Bacillus sp. BP-3]
MEKTKITSLQLFAMVMLFELGSALVVGLGMDAKKDAWLAIFLGWAGGMIVFGVYGFLFRQYPTLPLTGYLKKILGKYLGSLLGLVYILYFIYIASRVLRDFGELLTGSAYDETPLFVINSLMIVTMVYVLRKGIEVLARTGVLFFFLLFMLGVLGNTLILISGLVDFNHLLPILENGWKPVLKAAFPLTFTFPFGEMITFTMLFPYLNKPQQAMKIGYAAITLSAISLIFTIIVNIAVLGVDIASRATFPLLITIGKVDIVNFLQRLDIIVILTLIIGGFFKISIFFYAAVIGMRDIFKIKNHNKLIFPIGMIILFSSVQIANNFTEHIVEGLKVVPIYLHLPLQTGIPLLLLAISWLRKRLNS